MESSRISIRNIVTNDIKQTEIFIKRNNETIDRLRNSQTNVEFNRKQIEKLVIAQKDAEKKLENLNLY